MLIVAISTSNSLLFCLNDHTFTTTMYFKMNHSHLYSSLICDKIRPPYPQKKLLKSQVINDLITLLFNISLHNINSNLKKTSVKFFFYIFIYFFKLCSSNFCFKKWSTQSDQVTLFTSQPFVIVKYQLYSTFTNLQFTAWFAKLNKRLLEKIVCNITNDIAKDILLKCVHNCIYMYIFVMKI